MKKENLGFLQIVVAGILAGFIPLLIRFEKTLGAYNLAFFQVLISAVILGGYFLFFKNRLSKPFYEKKKIVLFGAVHGFIFLGYFFVIKSLGIALGVLLMYTFPIWMIPLSYFILGEKVDKKTFVALIVAFVGVVVLINPDGFLGGEFWGYVAGLGSGFGAALVYVMSKTFKKYDKVSLTFWQNLIAVPFVLPLVFVEFPLGVRILDWVIILMIGIISIFTFVLVFKGFEKIKAHRGGIVLFLDVLTPILLGILFFFELPDLRTVVGGVLILIGIFLSKE